MIPRKIALVPRVMMNGCSPVQLTEQPLIAPQCAANQYTANHRCEKRVNTCQHQFGGHHTGKRQNRANREVDTSDQG